MPDATPTTASAFVPEVWALRAMQILRANMVMANLVTRDSDVGSFTVGDILHIPFPGTFVANDKTVNTSVQLQAPSDSEVTVTLNKHKEVTFLVEDITRALVNQDVMDRYIRNAIVPIAQAIELDLFALYASLTNSVTSATMNDAQVRAARLSLNKALVPLAGRNLVIAPEAESVLLGSSNLQSFFAFSEPSAVREGRLGRAYGLDIYMSQLVPLSTTLKNLAFTPDAFILASRALPETGNPGVDQLIVNDPESRLAFRQTVSYNANALGVQVTLDMLYGVNVLRNAAGTVVLTPSTG